MMREKKWKHYAEMMQRVECYVRSITNKRKQQHIIMGRMLSIQTTKNIL